MPCHLSEILGQKISLPVAQRDPCRFPGMASIHMAKATGERWDAGMGSALLALFHELLVQGLAGSRITTFLSHNLMSWQLQPCCKAPQKQHVDVKRLLIPW